MALGKEILEAKKVILNSLEYLKENPSDEEKEVMKQYVLDRLDTVIQSTRNPAEISFAYRLMSEVCFRIALSNIGHKKISMLESASSFTISAIEKAPNYPEYHEFLFEIYQQKEMDGLYPQLPSCVYDYTTISEELCFPDGSVLSDPYQHLPNEQTRLQSIKSRLESGYTNHLYKLMGSIDQSTVLPSFDQSTVRPNLNDWLTKLKICRETMYFFPEAVTLAGFMETLICYHVIRKCTNMLDHENFDDAQKKAFRCWITFSSDHISYLDKARVFDGIRCGFYYNSIWASTVLSRTEYSSNDLKGVIQRLDLLMTSITMDLDPVTNTCYSRFPSWYPEAPSFEKIKQQFVILKEGLSKVLSSYEPRGEHEEKSISEPTTTGR